MSSAPPSRSAIAEPKDRDLVRLHWPAELRPAFDALFGIDDAMADVIARSTQPALAAIKLAWWRERLEALDVSPAPAEPRLRVAATELLPRGVSGVELSRLEDGYAALLEEVHDPERIEARGGYLFGIGARLLDVTDPLLEIAGRLWATQQPKRSGHQTHFSAVELHQLARHRFPRALRPLTALACLAARDARKGQRIEPEGTPGRAAALIRHRFTGRL